MSLPGEGDVELLLFEIGGELFGAEATQVLRIDRPTAGARRLESLGTLAVGGRALIVEVDGGEAAQLEVDTVRGVRHVPIDSLRRWPGAVAARPYALGLWLDGDRAVPLIDLVELSRT